MAADIVNQQEHTLEYDSVFLLLYFIGDFRLPQACTFLTGLRPRRSFACELNKQQTLHWTSNHTRHSEAQHLKSPHSLAILVTTIRQHREMN